REDVVKFLSGLKYFVLAESLGGVESMINHSASMSHGSMTPSERESIGIYDTTLRLSIGIEDIQDLKDDLANALALI
ncbi:PLP-dependent transferase, partial [Aeromonas caviae]